MYLVAKVSGVVERLILWEGIPSSHISQVDALPLQRVLRDQLPILVIDDQTIYTTDGMSRW